MVRADALIWPCREYLESPHFFPRNARVFREGDPIRAVYFIKAGIVKIVSSVEGRDVLLALRTDYWPLGSVSATLGAPYTGSAITMTECQLCPVPVADFHRLRNTVPAVSIWFQHVLATELENQFHRTRQLATAGVTVKLEELLLRMLRLASRKRQDGSLRLDVQVSVTELADLVCASREHVSRVLTRLQARGIVVRDRDWIVAPAASPLTRLALQDRERPCVTQSTFIRDDLSQTAGAGVY